MPRQPQNGKVFRTWAYITVQIVVHRRGARRVMATGTPESRLHSATTLEFLG